jgi:uncharacterized protein YggL (DUF469 family)
VNKRLRKKKHIGEFRELGFAVELTLRSGLSAAEHNQFADEWIALVEARELAFGGGGSPKFDGFVTRAAGGSTTEEDRAALTTFVASHRHVVAHSIGPLVDAWR